VEAFPATASSSTQAPASSISERRVGRYDAPTTLGERSKTNQIAANDHAAAFTVAELLAELRKSCIDIELSTNEIEGWTVLVLPKFGDWTREHGEAPANALAKVLILLRDMGIGEMRTGGAA
jgi:hypothetical protein